MSARRRRGRAVAPGRTKAVPRSRPRPSPASSRRAASSGDLRAVESARRGLDQASESLRAAAAGLAQVADRIAAEALEAERSTLAAELASEQVLRDLLKLQRALDGAAAGALPADFEALRKLPAAILDWAQRRLGVSAHLAAGQELEIPADRLAGFALDGTLPAGGGLLRVRILAPGWRRGTRVLVPPRAMIVSSR